MKYIIIYYIIGLIVSTYFTYYYRIDEKTKTEPRKTDAFAGLYGVWFWPIQIIMFISKK